MAKKSDDNLENFFLSRVDNYNIDYREEDWHKLNEMLDASEAMKAAAFKQKMVWVGSGALLVISVVLLLWMSQNLTSRKVEDTKMIKESEASEGSTEKGDLNEATMQPMVVEKNQDIPILIDPGLNNIETSNENQTSEFEGNRNVEENTNQHSEITKPGPPLNDEITGSQDHLNQKDQFITAGSTDEITLNTVNETTSSNNAFNEVGTDRKEYYGNQISTLNLRPADMSQDLNATDVIVITDNYRVSSKDLEFQKKYSWNLSLAADYSAVGMTDFDGPSIRAGLSLEYYLSGRLSILAGVNYSVKTYTALGREYTPPYGFWTNGVVPNETLGECNVLDIPLNLTYYIPNLKGQAFFIRSGLSSWLMLEEHYYYNYNSNDPDLVKYWGGENENYHFFSILNFSAGFEHPINDKYSILAEPYVNIPLGGVGFGEVDLHSAGMKVTFKINRYKLTEIK